MQKIKNDDLNCKIYTPQSVANLMIRQLEIDWSKDFKILEPACGSGNISTLLVRDFLNNCNINNKKEIIHKLENNFIFFDTDEAALKKLYNNFQIIEKEFQLPKIKWYIKNIDLLTLKSDTFNNITHSICNPPYIASRTLSSKDRSLFKEMFESCKKGNYDVYYAFIEYLSKVTSVKSVVITPNSFLVNKSANQLRTVLNQKQCIIYNFLNQNLFQNVQVKTAITVISNKSTNTHQHIECSLTENEFISQNVNKDYQFINYNKNINTNTSINTYFNVNCGIATLNDAFFAIKPNEIVFENDTMIKFEKDKKLFTLSKKLLKPTVRYKSGIVKGYVIYPYDETYHELDMTVFKDYMHYHKSCKKNKESFVYGRKQGLKYTNQKQLVLPTIAKGLAAYECTNVLTMAGIYVTVKKEYLEHEDTLLNWFKENLNDISTYITPLSKPMGDGYYTFSTTNIKSYPINEKLI